jgi:hypothetical protein
LDKIRYEVEVVGDAPERQLRELVESVDEIPDSLGQGTRMRLVDATVGHTTQAP